jgi:colicin import membrane protein
VETEQEQVTALVHVEELTPLQLFAPGALNPILERIKAEVRAIETDISTEAGRKAIASTAYKIARSKTFIDGQRKALLGDRKKEIAAIDAEGKRVWEELESLQEEFRKPLTDWEQARDEKAAECERRITNMQSVSVAMFISLESVERAQEDLDGWFDHNFEDFTKKAAQAHDRSAGYLANERLRLKREADEAAERERTRIAAEEKARVEREAKIAEDARLKAEAEARRREEAHALAAKQREEEQARIAAEDKARLEREKKASEARLQKSLDDARAKAQRDKLAAEERERKAEADRKESEEVLRKLVAGTKERERKAEEERVAALRQELLDRETAKKKAEAEREAAVAAERKRQDDIRAAEEQKRDAIVRERKKREADKAHRAEIGSAAVYVLTEHGIDPASAVVVIGLIDAGEVPNVTITY